MRVVQRGLLDGISNVPAARNCNKALNPHVHKQTNTNIHARSIFVIKLPNRTILTGPGPIPGVIPQNLKPYLEAPLAHPHSITPALLLSPPFFLSAVCPIKLPSIPRSRSRRTGVD